MQLHILVFFLFCQSFTACRAEQEKIPVSAANIGFESLYGGLGDPDKAPPTANIIFKSADGGNTWQDISAGLPKDVDAGCLYVNKGEVFLGTENGLYRSHETSAAPVWGKEPWMNKSISNILPGQAGPYLISYGVGIFQGIPGTGIWLQVFTTLKEHTNSVRTLLETADGTILIGCDGGIFRSADQGQTWNKVFEDDIISIVASGGVLMASGYKGVQRSTDGGAHWENVFNANILIKNMSVLNGSFAAILGTKDSREPTPGGITSRLQVSADGGNTWQRMEKALLPLQHVYDMDESLAKTLDLYDIVQAGGNLFCSFDTGLYRSADQGKTWELVLHNTGGMQFNMTVSGKTVYAVAVDLYKAPPATATTIFKSTNSGATWQDISAGLPENLEIGSVFANDSEVFLSAQNALYRSSTFSEATWKKETLLNEPISGIFPGRNGPYLSSYEGGFFQEILGTGVWLPLYSTLEDKRVRTILETSDGAILVGCDSGIFKSTDGGSTWKHVFAEGIIYNMVASGGALIAGGQKGMLRSTDGGEHWDWVLTDSGWAIKTECLGNQVVAITGGGTWKEITEKNITTRLRTSADGGKTWKPMNESTVPEEKKYSTETGKTLRDIYDIKQVGTYLFCSFENGVFRSDDHGTTWELVLPTIGKKMFYLAVSGQTIYVVAVTGC